MNTIIFLHSLGLFLSVFYGFMFLLCSIGSFTNKLILDLKIFICTNFIYLMLSIGVALYSATL